MLGLFGAQAVRVNNEVSLPPPLLKGVVDRLDEKVIEAGGYSTPELEYWQNVTSEEIPGLMGSDFDQV